MNLLREELAAYAHETWSDQMIFMYGKTEDIPDRWRLDVEGSYETLSEESKIDHRAEADKMLQVFRHHRELDSLSWEEYNRKTLGDEETK